MLENNNEIIKRIVWESCYLAVTCGLVQLDTDLPSRLRTGPGGAQVKGALSFPTVSLKMCLVISESQM